MKNKKEWSIRRLYRESFTFRWGARFFILTMTFSLISSLIILGYQEWSRTDCKKESYEGCIAALKEANLIKSEILNSEIQAGIELNYSKIVYEKTGFTEDEINKMAIQVKNLARNHFDIGLAYSTLGDYSLAFENYQKAINVNPNHQAAWFNGGIALSNLKRYEEALKFFDKSIELFPEYPPNWNNRGMTLVHLKRYEEAVAAFKRAIELNPNDILFWNNLANTLGVLNMHQEAIDAFDKVIELDPSIWYIYYNKGNEFFRLGDYEKAIENYNKSIQLNQNYALTWNNLGVTLNNLNRTEEAQKAFERANNVDPNLQDTIRKSHEVGFSLKLGD